MSRRSTLFKALEFARYENDNVKQQDEDPICYYQVGKLVIERHIRCFELQRVLDPTEMTNALNALTIAATRYDALGQPDKAAESRSLIETGQMYLEAYEVSKTGNKPDRAIPHSPRR